MEDREYGSPCTAASGRVQNIVFRVGNRMNGQTVLPEPQSDGSGVRRMVERHEPIPNWPVPSARMNYTWRVVGLQSLALKPLQ